MVSSQGTIALHLICFIYVTMSGRDYHVVRAARVDPSQTLRQQHLTLCPIVYEYSLDMSLSLIRAY
jgi:hypothetical protein